MLDDLTGTCIVDMLLDACLCMCSHNYTVLFWSSVVIWDLARKEALCGSPACMQSAGPVYALAYSRHDDNVFVTGGE